MAAPAALMAPVAEVPAATTPTAVTTEPLAIAVPIAALLKFYCELGTVRDFSFESVILHFPSSS